MRVARAAAWSANRGGGCGRSPRSPGQDGDTRATDSAQQTRIYEGEPLEMRLSWCEHLRCPNNPPFSSLRGVGRVPVNKDAKLGLAAAQGPAGPRPTPRTPFWPCVCPSVCPLSMVSLRHNWRRGTFAAQRGGRWTARGCLQQGRTCIPPLNKVVSRFRFSLQIRLYWPAECSPTLVAITRVEVGWRVQPTAPARPSSLSVGRFLAACAPDVARLTKSYPTFQPGGKIYASLSLFPKLLLWLTGTLLAFTEWPIAAAPGDGAGRGGRGSRRYAMEMK